MEDSLSYRDIAITAAVVIPASIAWVYTERLIPAAALGVIIYGAIGYGYPMFRRTTTYTVEPLVNLYEQGRDSLRARTARKA